MFQDQYKTVSENLHRRNICKMAAKSVDRKTQNKALAHLLSFLKHYDKEGLFIY